MQMPPIQVVRLTKPKEIRILRNFRDETQPDVPVDITGYTIKLIVKKRLSDEDALAFFDLEASIEDAENGVYKLTFTTAHTCLAHGTYKGLLRVWGGAASGSPKDAFPLDFVVTEAVKRYEDA